MNKDLIIKLVKVANNLDEMGFSKEANHLDKIASKIVVSFTSTGIYKDDINQYKVLFLNKNMMKLINLYILYWIVKSTIKNKKKHLCIKLVV